MATAKRYTVNSGFWGTGKDGRGYWITPENAHLISELLRPEVIAEHVRAETLTELDADAALSAPVLGRSAEYEGPVVEPTPDEETAPSGSARRAKKAKE